MINVAVSWKTVCWPGVLEGCATWEHKSILVLILVFSWDRVSFLPSSGVLPSTSAHLHIHSNQLMVKFCTRPEKWAGGFSFLTLPSNHLSLDGVRLDCNCCKTLWVYAHCKELNFCSINWIVNFQVVQSWSGSQHCSVWPLHWRL